MKRLENTFRSKGMQYDVLERFTVQSGDTTNDYVYCVVDQSHFAIMEVIQDEECERFGTIIPAHERIPSSEQWGSKAWSFQTPKQADKKKRELEARV